MMSPKAWSILPLTFFLVGCVSMAPRYRVPESPVSKAWPEGPAYKTATTDPSGPAATGLAWQDFYVVRA
jgi:multidrug efflux system outer membrane protein